MSIMNSLQNAVIKLGEEDFKVIKMPSTASKPSKASPSEGESPSGFFMLREKPKLTILAGPMVDRSSNSWKNFGLSMWKHLCSNNLNVEWVKCYLYYFFLEEVGECTEEWKSYDITLTSESDGKHIASPWGSLNIEVKSDPLPGRFEIVTSGALPKDLHFKLALALTGINRIIRAFNRDYKELLTQALQPKVGLTISGTNTPELFNFTLASTAYTSWAQDAGFCKMMAALDMFYYRFKTNQYSLIRWGTITCRDKDLGALMALEDLRLQTESSKLSEVMSWMWLESIGREIMKLMETEVDLLEATDPHSYFHYQSDLKAVNSSKYASVHNRKLYTFTHMVGTLLNQRRSYHANLIEATNAHSLYKNAIFVAYACRVSHEFRRVFAPVAQRDAFAAAIIDPKQDEEDVEEIPEPKKRDPLAWFLYWRGKGFEKTPKMQAWLTSVVGSITGVRVGTIGEWVHENGAILA